MAILRFTIFLWFHFLQCRKPLNSGELGYWSSVVVVVEGGKNDRRRIIIASEFLWNRMWDLQQKRFCLFNNKMSNVLVGFEQDMIIYPEYSSVCSGKPHDWYMSCYENCWQTWFLLHFIWSEHINSVLGNSETGYPLLTSEFLITTPDHKRDFKRPWKLLISAVNCGGLVSSAELQHSSKSAAHNSACACVTGVYMDSWSYIVFL